MRSKHNCNYFTLTTFQCYQYYLLRVVGCEDKVPVVGVVAVDHLIGSDPGRVVHPLHSFWSSPGLHPSQSALLQQVKLRTAKQSTCYNQDR